MDRDDWTGLGVSVGLHALLLLFFAVMSGATEPPPLGLIEVEFGAFEMAQPAAQAETVKPTPTQPRPDPQPEKPAPKPTPPKAEPVKLPDRTPTPEPEAVPPPTPTETTPEPERQDEPEQPIADPAPTEQAGGNPAGTTGSTSEAGGEGESTQRRAPYSIDGLNRDPTSDPMPSNPGATGRVVVNICVAPDGRLTRQWPAQRSGQPELDRAVQQALSRWTFNSLPPAAPQEEQCGQITFTFVLN
jgi:protein TonB